LADSLALYLIKIFYYFLGWDILIADSKCKGFNDLIVDNVQKMHICIIIMYVTHIFSSIVWKILSVYCDQTIF